MNPSPADFGFERLTRFRSRYAGQECVLLCNGPSLRSVDFRLVGQRKIFGLNKIHLGFDLLGRAPDFLVCVNKKVLTQIAGVLPGLQALKFLGNRGGLLLPPDPLTFYFNSLFDRDAPRFSTDIIRHVNEGWTVTHVALQLAYYFGFTKVVIVGMDHHFPEAPGEANAAHTMQGPDQNHFTPDYFGFGQEWDLPDLQKSEGSYREAKRVYEASGRLIIDATDSGHCQVFTKMPLAEALQVPAPALAADR